MTNDIGILAFGSYFPWRRLQRSAIHAANRWFAPQLARQAVGERAIANWDEDPITMAVEAARAALAGIDRDELGSISLASTTLPFADRLNSGIVKEALDLSDNVGAMDACGSQRAATSSLVQALRAARGSDRPHLALASEMRLSRPGSEAEMEQGDGAAAFLVGKGDPVARFLGSHSVTIDFVDHFRASGAKFDYSWEARWIRDEGHLGMVSGAIGKALDAMGIDAGEIQHFLVAIPAAGIAEALAKRCGISSGAVADSLMSRVGNTGAAHPFAMLSCTLEQANAGDLILLASFGQGVDVLVFEATAAVRPAGANVTLSEGVADENYMRWLFHRGHLAMDKGMRSESDEKQPGTTLWRNRRSVFGLVGGRCTRTGQVQFPMTDVSLDPASLGIKTQEPYGLADRMARVVTFTADNLAYSPSPPAYFGLVDFEGGGRLLADFTDCTADDIEVGREMRMVFRIKAFDETRGFTRYFWKGTPLRRGER